MSKAQETEVIQSEEERRLYANAAAAAEQYKNYTTEQVEKIFKAVGEAAFEKAEFYAQWALDETGCGRFEHKLIKKHLASKGELEFWNPADYIEPVVDAEKKIISFPKPAGIVVALSPITNPVLAVYSFALQMSLTRNAVIICPHPGSKECCIHAVKYLADVAEKAGAPKGSIQALEGISIPAVQSLMANRQTSLILAVGGPDMVHAAYSSGTPALGAGAANVPCYVHESADLEKAAAGIIQSSSFDNSVPCTAESVVLADQAISEELQAALKASGGYFVSSEEEAKLRAFCWPENDSKHPFNPKILGKSASWLAEQSGFSVPEGTETLVVKINEIGPHEPVSNEKLWPVLGYREVAGGVDEAIECALAMFEMKGKGHSANIQCTDPEIIARFGKAMPTLRVTVNIMNLLGAAGTGTGLEHTTLIGGGFFGRSMANGNTTPASFIQWTRIAYNLEDPVTAENLEAAAEAAKG